MLKGPNYKKEEWSEQLAVNDEKGELAASWLAVFARHGTLGLNASARGDVSNKRETRFLTVFPTASSCVQHAEEVCPCGAERQTAHP